MKTKKEKLGDCYEANFLKFMAIANKQRNRYRLVHAEVSGQGPLAGTRFGHAFILDVLSDEVMDYSNGRELRMSFEEYERAGEIKKIDNGHWYTFDEALEKAFETMVYGPWDLETSTGL